jgi:hypothetical protein
VRKRVDVLTIKRTSGHRTTKTIERYVHIHGEHIDYAIRALDIGGAGEITPELHTARKAAQEKSAEVRPLSLVRTGS